MKKGQEFNIFETTQFLLCSVRQIQAVIWFYDTKPNQKRHTQSAIGAPAKGFTALASSIVSTNIKYLLIIRAIIFNISMWHLRNSRISCFLIFIVFHDFVLMKNNLTI
jgi:hypothetical protein